jgi:trehalose-phosphatase
VDEALRDRPALSKAGCKKVFELRPAMPWDKGRAVLWLLSELGLDTPDVVPVYVGDDETDEDAFGALENRGIGILVTELPRPTRASHSLQDVEEVGMLLERLAVLRKSVTP